MTSDAVAHELLLGDARPRVWIVDDEAHVLSALARTLRADWAVTTFTEPHRALAQLELAVPEHVGPAVLMSDMRMPGMDGAQVLARAREVAPDTVRVLLTGQADLDAAVRSVNDGAVFRFLTKPCPREQLAAALADGLEQHRLLTSERVLLERTLAGAVAALIETLSLAAPQIFTRAIRVKRSALAIARAAGEELPWHDEIALTLVHLGTVSLPPGVLGKLDRHEALSREEAAMVERVPALSARLIGGIPRLERVQAALTAGRLRFDGAGSPPGEPVGTQLPLAARLLRIATALDRLTSTGMPVPEAVELLAQDDGAYDPALLAAARTTSGSARRNLKVVSVQDLRRGMTIAVDVVSTSGTLLIGRGNTVTLGLVEHLRNHAESGGLRSTGIVVEAP